MFRSLSVAVLYLSPGSTGSGSFWGVIPGLRSLRSLHPGLNSAACYAGSLNGSVPLVSLLLSRFCFPSLKNVRRTTGKGATSKARNAEVHAIEH